MLNIDTQHNVIPFVSGESKALSGQRLARVLYKGKSAFPSVCVSVPPVPTEWSADARLIPHIVRMLEDTQDKIIKGLYESRKGALDRVSDADIGLDAICGYLAGESAGERISAESIGAWFAAYVQNGLIVVLAEKLGYRDADTELTKEQEDTLMREVGKIKSIVALIASKGGISYNDVQKRVINRCFEISTAPDDHPMERKIRDRFDAQTAAKNLSDVLDF